MKSAHSILPSIILRFNGKRGLSRSTTLAKNETKNTGQAPRDSHDCKTISMLQMTYSDAKKEIKDGTSEYNIILLTAARANWLGTIKLLLDANAEVDGRDENGATALFYAAGLDHPKIVDALLKAKATVDARSPGDSGYTPLDLAASKGHSEVCELLLKAGASQILPAPTDPHPYSILR
jgi:hypothetical protein